MHTANKASGAIPRPSKLSPASDRVPSKATPRVAQLADDLAQKILAQLRGPVRTAALQALSSLGDEASARTWLDQRVTRKAIEAAEQALIDASKITRPPSSAPASSRVSMPSKQSKASDRRGAPPRTISPVPPSTISLATILESSDKSPQSSKSTESRSYRPPPPSSGPVGQT